MKQKKQSMHLSNLEGKNQVYQSIDKSNVLRSLGYFNLNSGLRIIEDCVIFLSWGHDDTLQYIPSPTPNIFCKVNHQRNTFFLEIHLAFFFLSQFTFTKVLRQSTGTPDVVHSAIESVLKVNSDKSTLQEAGSEMFHNTVGSNMFKELKS